MVRKHIECGPVNFKHFNIHNTVITLVIIIIILQQMK